MTEIPAYLTGRRAMIAAVGSAVVLLLLIIGVPVYASYSAQQAEIEDSLQQLARFRAETALRPSLEEKLKSLRARGATTIGYISAESVALAQADVERSIKELAVSHGADVRSIQTGPVGHQDVLDSISIQSEMSVPITQLKSLLYAVETHTPYLYIDQIDIAAPAGWQQSNGTEPRLEVHCTIHAYRWGTR